MAAAMAETAQGANVPSPDAHPSEGGCAAVAGDTDTSAPAAGSACTHTDAGSEYLLKVPLQDRARDTVNRIAAAAVAIVVEEGLSALTTNAIAKRAQINVATLYTYFANKEAILFRLGEYYEERRVQIVAELAERLDPGTGWRECLRAIIDGLVDFRVHEPGCVAIRDALQTIPEAPDFDSDSTVQAASALIGGFARLAPQLDAGQIAAISSFYATTVTSALDAAFAAQPYDAQAIDMLKQMTEAWLAGYFEGN